VAELLLQTLVELVSVEIGCQVRGVELVGRLGRVCVAETGERALDPFPLHSQQLVGAVGVHRGSLRTDRAEGGACAAAEHSIVPVANERKVPLWVSSQGRNNGYGGSSPRVRGSVVVNLRRMNRVLEIDEKLGYAVVEPGVRWFDLYEAIKAGGHRLMLSIADL